MRQVTKDEFDRFLREYPRELTCHVVAICEPPHREYHDFMIGKPFGNPDSQVAHIELNSAAPPIDGAHLLDCYFIDQE